MQLWINIFKRNSNKFRSKTHYIITIYLRTEDPQKPLVSVGCNTDSWCSAGTHTGYHIVFWGKKDIQTPECTLDDLCSSSVGGGVQLSSMKKRLVPHHLHVMTPMYEWNNRLNFVNALNFSLWHINCTLEDATGHWIRSLGILQNLGLKGEADEISGYLPEAPVNLKKDK